MPLGQTRLTNDRGMRFQVLTPRQPNRARGDFAQILDELDGVKA